MSGKEDQIRNILLWFTKVGIPAVMAGAPVKIGQSSGVDKGKEVAKEVPQIRQSPWTKQQQKEEKWMKFREGAIRIPRLP